MMSLTPSHSFITITLTLLCLTTVLLPPVLVRADGGTAFRTSDDPEPTEPKHGWYWGSIDANIDWCERNYSTTNYIAEFWNAISSIPIFLFALFGYFAVMLVGLGSFAFHATLRRYAQSMDELPMLWTSIALFYNCIDHKPDVDDPSFSHPGQPARINGTRPPPRSTAKFIPFFPIHPIFHRAGLKAILLATGIFLTTIYFYLPGLFVVFFVGYSTFLMSLIAILAFHIFFSQRAERKNRGSGGGYELVPLEGVTVSDSSASPPSAASNGTSPSASPVNSSPFNPQPLPNRPYSPVLGKLFWGALAGYFGGFVFWMYENNFCTTLPSWMQLHALWHIMAGLGSFCLIQCQLAWRSEEWGGKTQIDTKLGMGILPIIVVKYTQSE